VPDDESVFSRLQYETSANLRIRARMHQHYSTNPQGWAGWVWERMAIRPRMAILEIGCGDGALWRAHAQGLPAGCSILLTDLSAGMASAAFGTLAGELLSVAVADAVALPCSSESLDLVIANHMLYHVPDRAAALREIQRVLRPGGRLCATTVGVEHMREMHHWLIAACGRPLTPAMLHLPSFTLQSGAAELSRCFADVTREDYPDSLCVPDVDPVLDYMRSMWSALMGQEETRRLKETLRRELAEQGAIRIHKESGMLVAFKGGRGA